MLPLYLTNPVQALSVVKGHIKIFTTCGSSLYGQEKLAI